MSTDEERPRYTDPRARRLIGNAYVALGLALVPACFLGSYMVTAGGGMNSFAWGAIAAIFALSLGGVLCLALAPRLESRYAAARQQQWLAAEAAAEAAATEAEKTMAAVRAAASVAAFTPVDLPPAYPAPVQVVATPVQQPTAPAYVSPPLVPTQPVPAPVAPAVIQN